MSLHPQAAYPIPEETARVARAAFPNGNPLMLLRDELGMFAIDQEFAALFPARGQPAVSPSRLFFITIIQFMEGLTDRQAADAVRSRIDWKYALGLPLTDAGFDFSVLSEFRARLLQEEQACACLTRLLAVCQARGWLKARGRQRTDSTHILAAVRMLNRLECVGEAMRHALDALAVAAPEWLSGWIPSEWYERYRTRITDFQLPKGAAQRRAYGEQIGGDGVHLLQAVALPPAPAWLCDLPALVALRQIWAQQFVSDTLPTGRLRWRPEEALPPAAELIQSPHDLAARYSTKRATSWLGYKVHLTETCDDETPHLIVHVATTPATTHDTQVLEPIHADLAAQNRLPATHLVDSGYVDADLLLSSRQTYRVDLVGPIQRDHSWQAKAGNGFDTASFGVDWAAHSVRCPQGQSSSIWKPTRTAQGEPLIHVAFHRRTCAVCPARASCTRAATAGRELTLRPYAQHEAIAAARRYQDTQTFHERYAQRAGVEGTIAQGTRVCGLRRARYRGLAKTHLQHVLTAVAINALRITAWLQEDPRSKVHPSYFVRLARTA